MSIPDLMKLANSARGQLARAKDDLDRTLSTLRADLARIEEEAYCTLRAQSFEPSGSTMRIWCRTHDQALLRCESRDLEGCIVGTELDEGPGKSDPTGEAAGVQNGAKGLLKQVRHDLESLERITGHLAALVRPVATIQGGELVKVGKENEKAPEGCEPCGTHGAWSPPLTLEPTDVGGRLDRKQLLCRWHYGFAETHSSLPTADEEAQHQAGKRVTRRVKQRDRLMRGLVDGRLS